MNERTDWPYDAWISDFTDRGDNAGIEPNVMQRIKGLNDIIGGKGYAYPRFIASTADDFFSHIRSRYSTEVPVFKGSIENWWNMGAASTAYETAINKQNHDKLAMAETFATFAHLFADGTSYPHDRLTEAWRNTITYDEHTWGPADTSQVDSQWQWKRNTAIAADKTADGILKSSLAGLARQVPNEEQAQTVVVYNGLSWPRTDLVTLSLAALPPYFDVVDGVTGESEPFQKNSDATLSFAAHDVPALGYKTYRIQPRQSEPVFTTSLRQNGNTLENRFFRISFDATGSITSILDKAHADRELVDATAPVAFNQYEFNHGDHVTEAKLHGEIGKISGAVTAIGATGAASVEALSRKVILYESIPRIDVVNEVDKAEGGYQGAGYFVFPFLMRNFRIEHEMPTGDLWPHVTSDIHDEAMEQYVTSSTDHYTVNRWIDISNQSDYGITMAPINTALVEYGQAMARRMSMDYNTSTPWIYSMVFNNHWTTNFQRTQPGRITIKYSITTHHGEDWESGGAHTFGIDAASPLQATLIQGRQQGRLDPRQGHFIVLDRRNVLMTTAKIAEANGDGVILRFNEIAGRATTVTVDLALLNPLEVIETDLVENDRKALALDQQRVSFNIGAHGWKTLRLKAAAPSIPMAEVTASTSEDGTLVAWPDSAHDRLAYYEVFRGSHSDFVAGSGFFIGSTTRSSFFDRQVKASARNQYYYKVRAVAGGAKGEASWAARARPLGVADTRPPTTPRNVAVTRLHRTRSSLSWDAAVDDRAVAGYDIYRDGRKVDTVAPEHTSHLDTQGPWSSLPEYQIVAFDHVQNRSAPSTGATHGQPLPAWSNIAERASVSSSSAFSDQYPATNLVDGIVGRNGVGEWASRAEIDPSVTLTWNEPVTVRGVALFDRSNPVDDALHGSLVFSDGSRVRVTGIDPSGVPKLLTFPARQVTSLKFQIEGGRGENVGLSEWVVYGDESTQASAPRRKADATLF